MESIPTEGISIYFDDFGDMQWLKIKTDIVHDCDLADVEIEVIDSLPLKGTMAAQSTEVVMNASVFIRGW